MAGTKCLGKRNVEVGVRNTEERQHNKGAIHEMLCSGMQGINSGTLGTRNRENDPKAVHYCGHHPKPASCESPAGAEDVTLSNTRARGSNPKRAMSV